MNAAIATSTTAGTNHADTRSASPWIGARERCALATSLDDPGKHGLGADFFGPHHQRAIFVEGAGNQPVAFGLLDRHGLAGQHRFVDRGAPIQHDTVNRNRVARADTQAVAGMNLVERHVGLGPVVGNQPRGLWREVE